MGNKVNQLQFERRNSVIVIAFAHFDIDRFPQLVAPIVKALQAQVLEQQWDGDIRTWLIEVADQRFYFRGEHYTQRVWLEPFSIHDNPQSMQHVFNLLKPLRSSACESD